MTRERYLAGLRCASTEATARLSAAPATTPTVELDALHATLDALYLMDLAVGSGEMPWLEYSGEDDDEAVG